MKRLLNKLGLCTVQQLNDTVEDIYDDMSTLVADAPPAEIRQSDRGKLRLAVEGDYCLIDVKSGIVSGWINLAEMPRSTKIIVSVLRRSTNIKFPDTDELYHVVRAPIENKTEMQTVPMWDFPAINLPEGGEVRIQHEHGEVFPITYDLVVK